MTFNPRPKSPRQVNPHLRNLARGEACTGLLYGSYCHCDPATTVWAHSNSLAHGKGMGLKSGDHFGAFLGFDCHAFVDQGGASGEVREAFHAAAHARSVARLREIAAAAAAKPWRVQAARWALEQLDKDEKA